MAFVGPIIEPSEMVEAKQRALAGLPGRARARRKFEATVILLLSGPLAQERADREGLALREPPPPANKYSPAGVSLKLQEFASERAAMDAGEPKTPSDREQVMELLEAITANGAEASAYFDHLLARADTLVNTSSFWTPCVALAEALLQKETLSGRAAIKIMRQSFDPKPTSVAQELAALATTPTNWRSE
jgi:hypothetical protein